MKLNIDNVLYVSQVIGIIWDLTMFESFCVMVPSLLCVSTCVVWCTGVGYINYFAHSSNIIMNQSLHEFSFTINLVLEKSFTLHLVFFLS